MAKSKILLFFICYSSLLGTEFKSAVFQGPSFPIYTIHNQLDYCQNKSLDIYIEGDGVSWETKNKISSDPTPKKSIVLNLMHVSKEICKLYLARPCQYIHKNCDNKYWTSHRYGYKIIKNYNAILNNLKKKYTIKDFNLIGYSGGGVIATLIASQRNDIKTLTTIASNLDIEAWTKYHNISRLFGSLNPALYTSNLRDISQYHLIGLKDTIVPFKIFDAYYKQFDHKENIKYFMYENNHFTNWEDSYKEFLETIVQ